MKKLHYFPFYYLDWLSSSNVIMMTYEEKGLFIDMLSRCYNDDGLPEDSEKLKRLFNCDSTLLNSVKGMFYSVDGMLRNEKMDFVISEQIKLLKGKSKAGKASAKARAVKKLQQVTDVEQTLKSVATKTQRNSTNKTKQSKVNNKEQVERFELFWKAYPKKVMKGKAEITFLKLIENISLDVLLNGIKTSPQFQVLDKQYMPNAQAWLNGKGWEDENLNNQPLKVMTKEQRQEQIRNHRT